VPKHAWSVLVVSVLMVAGGCARPAALAPSDVSPPVAPAHLVPREPAPAAAPAVRPSPAPAEAPAPMPQRIVVGRSVEGRPLVLHRFSRWGGGTLVIGGIHGSEPTSAEVAERLVALLARRPDGWDDAPVAVLPRANPDGLVRGTRVNARGVDLNRNFATANWTLRQPGRATYGGPQPESEPETRALLRAIAMTAPARIVSIHSIPDGRECNNFDGPGEYLARAMRTENGYPVVPSLGPCRGSLGNWAGVDRGVPILTLELPRHQPGPEAWSRNRTALMTVIRPGRTAPRLADESVDGGERTTYHAADRRIDTSPVQEDTGGP